MVVNGISGVSVRDGQTSLVELLMLSFYVCSAELQT